MNFSGRIALVTGGSRGIGKGIVCQLAAAGAKVAFVYQSNRDAAEKLAGELAAAGQEVWALQADVSKKAETDGVVEQVLAKWEKIDVLVNNAGIQKPAASHEIEAADFDRVLSVNLRGPFLCSREAIRHFLSRPGGGVIINNSSVHEIIPKPKYLPYSISKGGMENLTKSLALEYAGQGIRVNAVGPGAVATPINKAWIDNPKARGEVESHIRTLSGQRITPPPEPAAPPPPAARRFYTSPGGWALTVGALVLGGTSGLLFGLTCYISQENLIGGTLAIGALATLLVVTQTLPARMVLRALAPLLIGMVLIAVIINLVQTRLWIGWRRESGALNIAEGMRKIFSRRAAFSLMLNLVKLAIIALIAWSAVGSRMERIVRLQNESADDMLSAGLSSRPCWPGRMSGAPAWRICRSRRRTTRP